MQYASKNRIDGLRGQRELSVSPLSFGGRKEPDAWDSYRFEDQVD